MRGRAGDRYPWGNEPDPNRANYGDTGIYTTSAVGCFPGGASRPYGVEDMSGNVWEWTRSLWEKGGKDWSAPIFMYPYRPDDGREELEVSNEVVLRVLRGGAFWDFHQDVRCASRGRNVPQGVLNSVGFRLVVAVRP